MHVFVTGADGFIGRPLVHALLASGHAVTGLARDDDSAERLQAAGARSITGNLADAALLTGAAREADGVIHLALELGPEVGAKDRAAIDALLAGLEGSGKPYVGASAAALVGDTRDEMVDETRPLPAGGPNSWRAENEARALAAKDRGVRAMVVRPAPMVFGRGGGQLIPKLIEDARASKAAHFVGSGAQAWSTAYVDDAAALFVAVLTSGQAGEAYFAASGEITPWAQIASAISRAAGQEGRTTSWTAEDAVRVVGFLGGLMALDVRVSNAKSKRLGWEPRGPALLEEIARYPVTNSH